MTRYALRLTPSWPYTIGKPGHVIPDGFPIEAEAHDLRRHLVNAEHYEVVQIDDEGQVVET